MYLILLITLGYDVNKISTKHKQYELSLKKRSVILYPITFELNSLKLCFFFVSNKRFKTLKMT